MFLKLLRKDCYILKQELHIMLRLKYGRISLMTISQTYGL